MEVRLEGYVIVTFMGTLWLMDHGPRLTDSVQSGSLTSFVFILFGRGCHEY